LLLWNAGARMGRKGHVTNERHLFHDASLRDSRRQAAHGEEGEDMLDLNANFVYPNEHHRT